MLFNFDLDGGPMSERMFTYTGLYLWYQDEATGEWELALLTSGLLSFLTSPGLVDICAVGPGEDGQPGRSNSAADVYGGDGGYGGELVNQTLRAARMAYPITVGDPGGVTSGLGVTARGGAHTGQIGTAPGTGGHVLNNAQARVAPTKGSDGALAFGGDDTRIPELAGTQFGASGAGARCTANYNGQNYPSTGGSTTGGTTGGGDGGSADSNGSPASAHTGSGGGGGGCNAGNSHSGGAGAAGAFLIRSHKEDAA